MKKLWVIAGLMSFAGLVAQTDNNNGVFKKRVLESTEINWLVSYYHQNGPHAAVTGGIGNEELKDFAQNIQVSMPVKEDNVLNLDITISGYTSASSSNLNPFSGASQGEEGDDNNNKNKFIAGDTDIPVTGSPWIASSGASRKDMWINFNLGYSHYSGDRNKIYGASVSIANEFDYFSTGGGLDFSSLFNEKNTEISVGTRIYLDHWRPQYPTEIKTYFETGGDLNAGYFEGVPISDQNGNETGKTGPDTWRPVSEGLIQDKHRNTYVLKLGFSQILGKNAQMSLFTDITYQTGWLANPMQRVYFADRPNYYIGNPAHIPLYTTPQNTEVFQLADDYEKLPHTRLKFPVGMRFHYYLNEFAVLRTYYRYYFDDWGLQAHTLDMEVPLKVSGSFTLYPSYRYYTQTAIKYFAPYETHLSTETFYTSDYDLSAFDAHQVGFGIKYTDIFTRMKLWKLGIKNIQVDVDRYWRSNGLKAFIVTWYVHFVLE